MKIGVFDSGKGGSYVADRLSVMLPHHSYVVVNDHENVPYGDRSQGEIVALTDAAIQPLLYDCPIIVLACNTATAAAINTLRSRYPTVRFVGYEPMIKPIGKLTTHGIILATAATRHSTRYQLLKDNFGAGMQLDEPETTDWATFIEQGTPEKISLDEVDASVASGAQVISLSCTHYLALEQVLANRYPQVTVIEPTYAVANRIKTLTAQLQDD